MYKRFDSVTNKVYTTTHEICVRFLSQYRLYKTNIYIKKKKKRDVNFFLRNFDSARNFLLITKKNVIPSQEDINFTSPKTKI